MDYIPIAGLCCWPYGGGDSIASSWVGFDRCYIDCVMGEYFAWMVLQVSIDEYQAAATFFIVTIRPRSSPTSLLAFFITAFVVELSLLLSFMTYSMLRLVCHYITLSAAALACIIICLMPMRAPNLPCIDIAAVGQQPSNHFCSPEDNLRLWQFLTVIWMAPLISIGRKRQLHEDDVWFLGFEFQHRRLHDKFRRLRGSVINRLLQANGIDIFIITVISIVQMLCGKFFRHGLVRI